VCRIYTYIPFYHNHTKANVVLTNEQAKEEWNHEQKEQVQAGQEIETDYRGYFS